MLCTPRIAKAILGNIPLLHEQFPIPLKSAKPVLCTPRIAKAILVNIPLLHEQFPIPLKSTLNRFQGASCVLFYCVIFFFVCTLSFVLHSTLINGYSQAILLSALLCHILRSWSLTSHLHYRQNSKPLPLPLQAS